MTNPARSERSALCVLFRAVGPDAPTLCGEWTTRDLAAHLVVREHRPDAAVGIVVKALSGHGEKVRLGVARKPWDQLVEEVRSGPPLWSPTRIPAVDGLVNTVEFFVHHEDVRRGAGVTEPRSLDAVLSAALWSALSRMAKLLVRSAPGGLTFVEPTLGTLVAKAGDPTVTVTGAVGELVLYAYGRQSMCRVEVSGPVDLVASTGTASFGV